MHTLSVVADFTCPWCYIGKARLDEALARLPEAQRPARRFLPFRLNPGLPPEGMERTAYRIAKFGSQERSDQLDLQVRLAAEESGVTIDHARMTRTPDTVKAHMLMAMAASLAGAGDRADRLADRLYAAYFPQGVDIGQDEALLALAQEAGLSAGIAEAALADAELRAATVALADGLARQGISGVPTLLIDRHVLASGALPADDLARILPQAMAILDEAAPAGGPA